MECYFLSRPFDEEGNPIRGYKKQMHAIWKERQSFKVREQIMIGQDEWVANRTRDECNKKKHDE